MATKWCTKLEVALKRCPIVFQGHPENAKVTRLKKLSNLTQIGCFRTVTPVWIHQWLQIMHKAWSSIEEVPYCFARSSVKFQGRTALKIVEFDPDWAFPDCNSSFNSPMATKYCTKLETAKERCPIVFQGHPSNFKVTRDKTSPILTQIGHFRTIGRSQLSNPSDLPCLLLAGSPFDNELIIYISVLFASNQRSTWLAGYAFDNELIISVSFASNQTSTWFATCLGVIFQFHVRLLYKSWILNFKWKFSSRDLIII